MKHPTNFYKKTLEELKKHNDSTVWYIKKYSES